MDVNTVCPGCLEKTGVGDICPRCGFDRNSHRDSKYLPYGYILSGRYLLGRVLEENGDGITYLALDTADSTKIRVREFFPDGLCSRNSENGLVIRNGDEFRFRDALENFKSLWKKLAHLRGISAIVPVFDIIECNNSVYAVCEYYDDITLRDYLMDNGGFLTWEQAKPLLMPVLSCIKSLHVSGIIHYGISPYTILMGSDGKLRLWGFSIKEIRLFNNTYENEIYEGYAPIEAYNPSFECSERSDVYSFGAVLYRTLVGITPIDSKIRYTNDQLVVPAAIAEKMQPCVINALVNSLQVLPEDRTVSVDRMRDELLATPSVIESANEKREVPSKEQKPQKKEKVAVTVISRSEDRANAKMKIERLVFACIILAMIIAFSLLSFTGVITFNKNGSANGENPSDSVKVQESYITVPNFIGQDKDSQDYKTMYPDLNIVFEQAVISYTPENKIVSQSIAANTRVAPGTQIVLSYYGPSGTVVIPDLTGLTSEEALLTLGSLGLNNVKTVEKNNDSGYTQNTVASQTPEKGEVLTKDAEIVLYVWSEPKSQSNGGTSQRTQNATSIIDSVFSGIGSLFGR